MTFKEFDKRRQHTWMYRSILGRDNNDEIGQLRVQLYPCAGHNMKYHSIKFCADLAYIKDSLDYLAFRTECQSHSRPFNSECIALECRSWELSRGHKLCSTRRWPTKHTDGTDSFRKSCTSCRSKSWEEVKVCCSLLRTSLHLGTLPFEFHCSLTCSNSVNT